MRPTNLGFRSPKERTAEFYLPCVTFDGRALPFLQQKFNQTLGKSRRFSQYEIAAKRTSSLVGPGAYNISSDPVKHWSIAGTPVIRPYAMIKDPTQNGYYFIGNQVVYDPEFGKNHRKAESTENSEFKAVKTSTSFVPRRNRQKSLENSLRISSPYADPPQKNPKQLIKS